MKQGQQSHTERKKIAVIGAGVAGLSVTSFLHSRHDVTLYEKDKRLGGHSNTIDVNIGGRRFSVDAGFLIFNPTNYPNLTALFKHLGVAYQRSPANVGFSNRRSGSDGLEYSTNMRGLTLPENLTNPRFIGLLKQIARFNKQARRDLKSGVLSFDTTLSDYLDNKRASQYFRDNYLLPAGAAIWSTSPELMQDYPARSFLQYFDNHGLLGVRIDRLRPWYTVTGGSYKYVQKLSAPFADKIQLDQAVQRVRRTASSQVEVTTQNGTETYDYVIFATHPPQTLKVVTDLSDQESSILASFRYQPNTVAVHTDQAQMPRRRAAWDSYNCVIDDHGTSATYWMNRIQSITAPENIFVTLNPTQPVDQNKMHREISYEHPVFDKKAIRAQQNLDKIQGNGGLYFCGAYTGYGFHEDGLKSAIRIAKCLGVRPNWL